jgi:hypothetical protein
VVPVRVVLLMMLACGVSARAADHPLVMKVSPVVASAPSDVMIDTRIEPPSNESRHLEVEIDSGGYFRASTIDIDEKSARVITVRFRQVPAGEYEVRVELLSSDGRSVGFASQWISLT